ncbi:hypothetical protein C8R46DRAFT_1343227 [Mycena filopes]|nr:hypothetical protein C8R46DRAFT_1343227 [Mycena filopes]
MAAPVLTAPRAKFPVTQYGSVLCTVVDQGVPVPQAPCESAFQLLTWYAHSVTSVFPLPSVYLSQYFILSRSSRCFSLICAIIYVPQLGPLGSLVPRRYILPVFHIACQLANPPRRSSGTSLETRSHVVVRCMSALI